MNPRSKSHNEASSVVGVAGRLCSWAEATHDSLRKFSQYACIPVAAPRGGKGAVSPSLELAPFGQI